MGADLYILSISDRLSQKYESKFASAGYFRDSYNDSNLFWKLGLDYWVWFAGYLDDEGHLSPENAALVLEEIQSRKHKLDEIEAAEDQHYFHEKYDELVGFLQTAIELDEPIVCSI